MKRLLTEASLIMKPEGQADGLLPSVKPIDGSGDFTFSRGSNLAATRVNQAGLIEKGRENLLLQSNTFDTTWTTNSVSITGSQAGYDGSNDAWKSTNINPYGRIIQNVTSSGVSTFSMYAKAGNSPYFRMQFQSVGSDAYFDLSDGSVIKNEATIINAGTEYVGNGWYRVFASVNEAITDVRVVHTGAGGIGGGSTGDYFYIQNAQLEQGLAATPYIPTAATTAKAGVLEATPRLDYSGGATEPSLLLEPQRTNIAINSEYFQNYNTTRQTLVHNSTASPEGLINATELNDTAVSGTHFIQIRNGVVDGGVLSFFAKQNTHRYVQAGPSSSISKRVFFDLQDGVMATIGNDAESYYGIEDYGNGWYRCYIAFGNLESPSIFNAVGDGSNFAHNNYTGDGSGVYIYGAQVEQDVSYHTSYIPTYGSNVTRVLETCQVEDESALINSEQGALYFEGIAIDPSFANVMSFSDGTLSNRICLTLPQNATNINAFSSVGGSKIDNDILHDPSVNSKYAIVWNGNSFKVFVNGVKEVDNTMSGSFSANTLTDIRFDRGDGALNFGGFCKSYLSIASALTDAECIALTSL